jgi:putative ABC transport system substrate-binding protein
MDRRAFIGTLTGGLLAAPVVAPAQPTGKVYRVGVLSQGLAPISAPNPFGVRLRELGWVDGRNVVFEEVNPGGSADLLSTLAADLARRGVDAIIAIGPPSVLAAQKATTTIPIVMVGIVDPIALGLVSSFAHPGSNITGIAWGTGPEVAAKQLEFLKEAMPASSRRVAYLNNADNPGAAVYVPVVEAAGMRLSLEVRSFGLSSASALEAFLARVSEWQPHGMMIVGDPVWLILRSPVVEFAGRNRLPATYGFKQFVLDGGLMSYGPDLDDVSQRTAVYVDKLLKGAKPADLPIEQPTKFELAINLKTAKALGLTIPQSLLQRADQVIQ